MSKRIGFVLAVTGTGITLEVDPEISDLHIRHEGKTYTIGQPGSYLVVDGGHDKHLVLVSTVRKSRWISALQNVTKSTETSPLPAGSFPFLPPSDQQIDRTLIDGILVGTISGGSFEVGVTRFPVVGDKVTLALEDHLKIALSPPKGRHTISLGPFVDTSYPVYLDLDHLLGKHTAIVGTTGCGKSYAVARLVQEIVSNYPAANIIVFDLHGEYGNAFEPARYIRADRLSLPAWLHSFEDLFNLCADLSNQFNIHNQRWAFREGILKLKQKYCKEILKDQDLANQIDLDAPIPFRIEELQNYFHNLNTQTVNSSSGATELADNEIEEWFERRMKFKPKETRKIKGGPLEGQLDRLVLRVDSRVADPRYAFMFKYESPKKDQLATIAKGISGFLGSDSTPVTVFDLSYLPSETVGTVVATISRLLFQVHFLSKRAETTPTLAVFEEAHNYISKTGAGAYGEARSSVERIAKEGRKFGVGTLVVSQRPSELSETLLSQCNTFLCMRLANSVDKNHIVALLPESMNSLVDVLPALPRGHMIAIGQASKMPVRFIVSEISNEDRCPLSEDPKFGNHWKKHIRERAEPDIEAVCDLWIRSKKPDT